MSSSPWRGRLGVLVNALVVLVVAAALVSVAGCGGSGKSAASPIHVVNTWVKSLHVSNFGTACRQMDPRLYAGQIQQCSGYFALIQAMSGNVPDGHAIPHSERINGDSATVRMVLQGGPAVAHLRKLKSGWKLESVGPK